MTAPTHVAGGIAMLAFFDLLFPAYNLDLRLVLWGSLFSLLPDIDNPRSFVGRILFFISQPFERRFSHRTASHSFFATILVGGASYLAVYLYLHSHSTALLWSFTLSVAYFSHLLFDAMTKQGILAYWPSRLWGVIPSRASWRIRTGARAELIYFSIFTVGALIFLPLGQAGIIAGFNRLFQPGAARVRLQQLEYNTRTAARGLTEPQIDSLLEADAIDPKQAAELKAKLTDAQLQEERFRLDQGMSNE